MQRSRFAMAAAIVVLGLGATTAWRADRRSDCQPAGMAAAGAAVTRRFVIAPGDDPSALPLHVENARVIEIDRTGTLLVHIGAHVKRQPKPRAYQDIGGRRHEVSIRFDIAPDGDPRVVFGPYDRTSSLVIELQPEQVDQ